MRKRMLRGALVLALCAGVGLAAQAAERDEPDKPASSWSWLFPFGGSAKPVEKPKVEEPPPPVKPAGPTAGNQRDRRTKQRPKK